MANFEVYYLVKVVAFIGDTKWPLINPFRIVITCDVMCLDVKIK